MLCFLILLFFLFVWFDLVLFTQRCGAELAGERALHRQQSLPHRPVIPLVARMADQNTSGTPAMTEREASRLDKFKQILAGPNTDLGEMPLLHFAHSACRCNWLTAFLLDYLTYCNWFKTLLADNWFYLIYLFIIIM